MAALARILGTFALAAAMVHGAPHVARYNSTYSQCKNIPGDPGWPSQHDWDTLNSTVGGRLVATQLLANICHTQTIGPVPLGPYDEEQCDALQGVYDEAATHQGWSAEVLNPYVQGTSCSPWGPKDQPCTLGNYVSYAINVSMSSAAADVAAGIQFAREHNIRLVVKNTGHDYVGRSTGTGGLSLWTHNVQGYQVIQNYTRQDYTGPAIRLAAGVQGYQAMEYVHDIGYRIVGGECPTVGIAGGYTTGGGHSLLNSKYGMAADSVLEWEVVTPDGKLVTATPYENSDLYWAMTGGGGGTWGVSLSMTTKIYPDGIVAGARLVFNSTGASDETYWNATARFYAFLPGYTDKGNSATWGQTSTSFSALTLTMPDITASEGAALWAPLLGEFDEMGLSYSFEPLQADSYYDHFDRDYGPLPYGTEPAATAHFTGRIVPRAVIADPTSTEAQDFIGVVKNITGSLQDGFEFGCNAASVGRWAGADNAVLAAWRDSVGFCVIVRQWDREVSFDENLAVKEFMVDDLVPALEAATPGGAIYVNEVDPLYRGDWKVEGYGDKYEKLLAIKDKYDPDGIFWAPLSVGSDRFTVDNEGRVCRV
ncbi:putative isoamyl alcohol oxidase [Xylariomycetidae sp. FL2044]|nr:putative isoamyl alcohol oxidase [Xylariomycetidae sp. FL2044]